MHKDNILLLRDLANKYETKDFIAQDPISFPHRYKKKTDIEIAGFVAQWLAYGKRELFLKILDFIGQEFGGSPYDYIGNRGYEKFKNDKNCLYRFYKNEDFYYLCNSLHNTYFNIGKGELSMEDILTKTLPQATDNEFETVLKQIIAMFANLNGIPKDTKSACKRLCMFLRWLVRKNSVVDFGIWNIIEVKNLVIPLDTHVFRQSRLFGLTHRNQADFKTAIEITNNLKKVFKNDPTKADFALFGLGVDTH